MCRSFIDIYGIVVKDMRVIFPFWKILEAITPHDNRELMSWIFLLHISEGVCRERGFGQFELYIRCFQSIFSFYRHLYQVETIIFIQAASAGLERNLRGATKPPLTKFLVLQSLACIV